MKLRIEKIYGTFYHQGFDKYEVVARCYFNGGFHFKRLFFHIEEEVKALKEGVWINY